MRSWPSAPCGHQWPRHCIRRPTQSGNWDYYLRLAEGAVVFAKACGLCLEGVIWKRAGSFYRSGKSHRWLDVYRTAPGCMVSIAHTVATLTAHTMATQTGLMLKPRAFT